MRPNNQKDLRQALFENALFVGVPREELEKIFEGLRLLTLDENEIVYEDSDTSRSVYLVAQGSIGFLVRADRGSGWRETGVCETGSYFGEGAALENRDKGVPRSLNSRARIVSREESVLLVVPSELFRDIINRYPVALASNLTRTTSDKSRRFVQAQSDAAIQLESVRIFENVLDWISSRCLDSITVIQLNAGLVQEENEKNTISEASEEILTACKRIGHSFEALSEMARVTDTVTTHESFSTEIWWESFSPQLLELLRAKEITCSSYFERRTIRTSRTRIERAFVWCFESISRVSREGGAVSAIGGAVHAQYIVSISFHFPMLTEYLAQRLTVPFSVSGKYGDIFIGFALCHRLLVSIGGSLEIEKRSGENVTLAAKIPLLSAEDR